MRELELKIECPVCGVRAFEDCYIRPNESYTIQHGPMMHVARIVVQKMDCPAKCLDGNIIEFRVLLRADFYRTGTKGK